MSNVPFLYFLKELLNNPVVRFIYVHYFSHLHPPLPESVVNQKVTVVRGISCILALQVAQAYLYQALQLPAYGISYI
jgi:hypothetical protein